MLFRSSKTTKTENQSDNQTDSKEATRPVFTPKIKSHVTLPLLKLELDTQYYLRFESEPWKAKAVSGQDKQPPTLCRVTNLETGELAEIIMPVVLEKELADAYPDGLKGLGFAVIKHKLESKKYSTWEIAELDLS